MRAFAHMSKHPCYMHHVHFFEREVRGRRYRVAAQSVWDSEASRSVARQAILGPADPPLTMDLGATRTVGTRGVGDVGALAWVAEQLDLIGHIDRACGSRGAKNGPSLGEMVLAVAIQRACAAGPKRDLADFLGDNVPRVSCLPDKAFSGQAFHRLAQQVTEEELEAAQVALAGAAVRRFELSTDVLAFDTTNFDTHIATTTPGDLARRGHAKSKRSDLRVVGLGLLVSETGHVPLLYRTYSGNSSDQAVLESCLNGLSKLHDALDAGEGRDKPGARTLVRDGGVWSPQLELHLDTIGYYTLISLPLGHGASERALEHAAQPRAMKKLKGTLKDERAARLRTKVGDLDRTLVVVESKELLAGQKRGIEGALAKAKIELRKLEQLVKAGRIRLSALQERVRKVLGREHLASFVVADTGGDEAAPRWRGTSTMPAEAPGEDAPRPPRALHRPPLVGHRAHRPRVSRSVERGGDVSPLEEGRRCSLGAVVPVGGQLAAPAHLRVGARSDAREPREDRARHGRLPPRDDGVPGRYPGHPGAYDDGRHGAATHDHAGAGPDRRTAQGRRGFRVGPVDAIPCFM